MPYVFTFPRTMRSHGMGTCYISVTWTNALASDSVQSHSLGTHYWCHLCRSPDETYKYWVYWVTGPPNGDKQLPFLCGAPRRRAARECKLAWAMLSNLSSWAWATEWPIPAASGSILELPAIVLSAWPWAMALYKETAHANVLHICTSSPAKKKSPLCATNKPVFEVFLKAFLSDHCLVFTEECYFLSKRKRVLRKDLLSQWREIAAHLAIARPCFAWPSKPRGQQSCVCWACGVAAASTPPLAARGRAHVFTPVHTCACTQAVPAAWRAEGSLHLLLLDKKQR